MKCIVCVKQVRPVGQYVAAGGTPFGKEQSENFSEVTGHGKIRLFGLPDIIIRITMHSTRSAKRILLSKFHTAGHFATIHPRRGHR